MPNIESERVRLLLEWAKNYFAKSGTILDIGSAGADDPFLLKALRSEISEQCKLVSIDMNIKSLEELKGPNLDIIAANLYQMPFEDQSFEGCIIAEVVEHLYDIVGALKETARVIKPGGILLLSTPNPFAGGRAWNSWYTHQSPADMTNLALSVGNLPKEKREEGSSHIQFYDPLSLCNLLFDSGFEVEEVTSTNFSRPLSVFSRKRNPLSWILEKYLLRQIGKLNNATPHNRLGVYTVIRAIRINK